MQRGRLPAIVVVGLVGSLVVHVVSLIHQLTGIAPSIGSQLWFADAASGFAAWLCVALGAAELAQRSAGRVALAMRIAMFGSLGVLGAWLVGSAMLAFQRVPDGNLALQWAFWGASLIAARDSRSRRACVARS